jgi:hypothetical protein
VHAQEESSKVLEQLDEVIGSADGKRFRVFAQSWAFEALLREANAHLADLAPRYLLLSVPGAALELQGGHLERANTIELEEMSVRRKNETWTAIRLPAQTICYRTLSHGSARMN